MRYRNGCLTKSHTYPSPTVTPTEVSLSAQFVPFPNPGEFGDEMGRVSDRPELAVRDVKPEEEEKEEEEKEGELLNQASKRLLLP